MRTRPRIPGMVLFVVALILLSTTLLLKERNIFSVMLWESEEGKVNVAEEIATWNNTQFTFITDPTVGNVTSCELYISSTGAELNQVIHGREVFFNNETQKYMWCDDTDALVLITPLLTDVDNYFQTFFSSREVECVEASDCDRVDTNCDRIDDEYAQCVENNCVTPEVICECYKGEDETCIRSRYTDNDCSIFFKARQTEDQGECVVGKCTYASRNIPVCSSFQLFFQKYKYPVFIGLGLIIAGIVIYNRRER